MKNSRWISPCSWTWQTPLHIWPNIRSALGMSTAYAPSGGLDPPTTPAASSPRRAALSPRKSARVWTLQSCIWMKRMWTRTSAVAAVEAVEPALSPSRFGSTAVVEAAAGFVVVVAVDEESELSSLSTLLMPPERPLLLLLLPALSPSFSSSMVSAAAGFFLGDDDS